MMFYIYIFASIDLRALSCYHVFLVGRFVTIIKCFECELIKTNTMLYLCQILPSAFPTNMHHIAVHSIINIHAISFIVTAIISLTSIYVVKNTGIFEGTNTKHTA